MRSLVTIVISKINLGEVQCSLLVTAIDFKSK